jgi:hypothetical protein
MRWFVLQAADAETGCPALEARFAVNDIALLRELLDADDASDFPAEYVLDDLSLKSIGTRFDVPFAAGGREVSLVPWHPLRELPYLVHTRFELALMREGRKPLVFADSPQWLELHVAPFARFVADGRITRRTVDRPDVREIYFTLPGEEWRVDAYRDLRTTTPWNEASERRQGKLLGYTDWENDCWVKWRAGLLA